MTQSASTYVFRHWRFLLEDHTRPGQQALRKCKGPATPERDGAKKGAPSSSGSIHADARQQPTAETIHWLRKAALQLLLDFGFAGRKMAQEPTWQRLPE